jgi:hypothetical protein
MFLPPMLAANSCDNREKTRPFQNWDGKLVNSEYCAYLFYGKNAIRKFRVIQHDYDEVEIQIAPAAVIRVETFDDVEKKIKMVMG